MGEYVHLFFAAQRPNIHLLSRYPAAREGFDNTVYRQDWKLMCSMWPVLAMPGWKVIKLLKLDSVFELITVQNVTNTDLL